ncbi:hypothetical protein ACFQ07_33960 [Actinomadura adrarensis]|uniref:Uncharacterized protein n=1 Tax=Actinomadura adrarensis TaxID=1819600 RepID=A0ABW3CT99_9ACTN
MFLGEVMGPVGVQVTVADDGAELEDRLGSGQPPPGAGDLQAVADQMTSRSFDDAGGDRPPAGQGVVVMQVVAVAGQVADGGLQPVAPVGG